MKYVPPKDPPPESINNPDFNKPWSGFRLLIKFFLFLVVPYFLIFGLLRFVPLNFFPVELEQLVGRWVTPKPTSHPEATKEMEKILAKIAPKKPRVPLVVTVTEKGSFNALTYPGGAIHFHKGAFDLLKHEPERATILGHEIAHSELGHIGRKVTSNLLLIAPNLILRSVGVDLFDFSQEVVANVFSRKDEFAADAYAAQLVLRHYGSLDSAIRAFEIMEVAVGDKDKGVVTEYSSTHPLTKDRIENLKRLKSGKGKGALSY